MKTLSNRLCFVCPENTPPELERSLVCTLRNYCGLRNYTFVLPKVPRTYEALGDEHITYELIAHIHDCDAFAFLPFPDGGIHFRHGKLLLDEWRYHTGLVYEITTHGDITLVSNPIMLRSRFLTREHTRDHIWSPDRYMRPLLH